MEGFGGAFGEAVGIDGEPGPGVALDMCRSVLGVLGVEGKVEAKSPVLGMEEEAEVEAVLVTGDGPFMDEPKDDGAALPPSAAVPMIGPRPAAISACMAAFSSSVIEISIAFPKSFPILCNIMRVLNQRAKSLAKRVKGCELT